MKWFSEEKIKQILWFTGGAICGLAMLSISKASVPDPNLSANVTDDSAIYQNLSEIHVDKDRAPNFDSDISHLSKIEDRYRDQLPGLAGRSNLRSSMQRISRQQYHYRGGQSVTSNASAWNDIPAPSSR